MNGINKHFSSINQVTDQFLTNKPESAKPKLPQNSPSFREILEEQTKLKFSKHASIRLNNRSIELTAGQMERLENGMIKAGAKGINESLVLVDDLAFIVNVPNKTVITAINKNETSENIFTNIDGAVII